MAITQQPTAPLVVTTNSATQDVTATLGSGTKRSIVVFVTREMTPTVTGVVFEPAGANAAFTQSVDVVHSTVSTLSIRAFVYHVPDGTASGSYTVRVSYSSSSVANFSTIYWWVVDGASSSAPELATGSDALGAANNVSVTGTVSVNAHVLAVAVNASAAATWAWSGGAVTEVTEQNETNYTTAAADGIASTTSVTVTAADGATSNKVLAVVSIAAASGAASPTPAFGRYGVRGPIR
jgi:hypothetical protein